MSNAWPVRLTEGAVLLRPIRPEDEQLLGQLLETLTPEDSRMRFFVLVRGQTHLQLARFSQIDYDREMSLVVIRKPGRPDQQVLAEARLSADADNEQADFAIVVSSLCSGRGLGRMLLQQLIEYARVRGIARLHGETLIESYWKSVAWPQQGLFIGEPLAAPFARR